MYKRLSLILIATLFGMTIQTKAQQLAGEGNWSGNASGTVDLTGEVTITGTVKVPSSKTLTINANGADRLIKRGSSFKGRMFSLGSKAKLEIVGSEQDTIVIDGGAVWNEYTGTDVHLKNIEEYCGRHSDNTGVTSSGVMIYCGGGQFSLDYVVLQNNYTKSDSERGGAIFAEGISGDITVNHSIVQDCHNTYYGGSVAYFRDEGSYNGNILFEDCKFIGCSMHGKLSGSEYASGTFRTNGGTYTNLTLRNCETHHCYSSNVGGFVHWNVGRNGSKNYMCTVENCNCYENVAFTAGGVLFNEGRMDISGCTFRNNKALGSNTTSDNNGLGGAIYSQTYRYVDQNYESVISLDENTLIENNEANLGGGVAFDLKYFANVNYTMNMIVNGATIRNNKAYKNGGAIYITKSTTNSKYKGGFTMNSGYIYGNEAGEDGGAIYTSGGVIDVIEGGYLGYLVDGAHIGNSANRGGSLFTSGGSLTINGGQIQYNESEGDGGGFYVSGGNVTISGGNISNNEVISGNGGAFFVSGGDVTINDGLISGNSSVCGGGGYVDGGNLTFTSGTISGNTATKNGGGAYVSLGIVKFKGNISDNSALNGGGLYLGPGASMEFQGGLIINNLADTTKTASVTRAKTAYHGGADVPGWGSSVIEGCGGGIYLQKGTSSKKTKLTFKFDDPNDKTFGLYTNRANMAGDDLVAEGQYTEVVLPSVREMQLYGFEGKDATPFWYQDYFYMDKGYDLSNGHAVTNDVNYIGRYRQMIQEFTNEYYNHRVADDIANTDRIKNYYLCLTLSYNMLDITISAKHLLGHETALFRLVRHGGTEDYKYDVLLRGDCTDSATGKSSRTLRNMPWGTYSIFPNDAWNWAYDKIPPQQNLRLGETGNYEFVFDMNHINGAEVPQHDERQPVRSAE